MIKNKLLKALTLLVATAILFGSVFCGVSASDLFGSRGITQPEKYDLPITFDEGYTPFAYYYAVTNVLGNQRTDGMSYNTDTVLNGTTSFKIEIPKVTGFSRLETASAKVAGNPNFKKDDFTAVTGIMLRIKVTNDGSAAHSFRLSLNQSGLDTTNLGRNAVLYNKDGSTAGVASSTDAGLAGSLPAGFDGFIFMPFTESRSNTIVSGVGYGNYTATPEKMVDVSKDYSMFFRLWSTNWAGATFIVDDISYYSGTTAVEHHNLLKGLGYELTAVAQPDKYSLPLTFEEQYNPFINVNNIYSGTEHPNQPGAGLIKNSDSLNGNYTLKIDAIRNGNARTETTPAAMTGNSDFSKTDFTKVTGIMFRLKLGNDNTIADHNLSIVLKQAGLPANTFLGRNAVLYDVNGEVKSTTTVSQSVRIPAKFDGFVFLPLESATSTHVCVQGVYDNYATTPEHMVDLSKDFNMYFMFGTLSGDTTWAGIEIYIDDIDYYSGATHYDHVAKMQDLGYAPTAVPQPEKYDLPLSFEEQYNPFISVDNVYSGADHWSAGGVGLVSENTLNGNYSVKVDAIKEGNSRTELTWASMKGNPNFSKTDFSKVSGIMLRLKIKGSAEGITHKFSLRINQTGLTNNTVLGRAAKLYDLSGNEIAQSANNLVSNLPADFDGFIFFAFENAQSLTVTTPGTYDNYKNYPESLVDLKEDYKLIFFFEGDNWGGCEVYIDDINYFTGTKHADNLNTIKSLGYTGITAVAQPDRYSFPLSFDDKFIPFTGVNNIYDNAEHPSNEGISLTGKDNALNGTESVKIETIRDGNSRTETNWVKMAPVANFSKSDFSKNTGIMLRVKIGGDKGEGTHQFALRFRQDGVRDMALGKDAKVYDLKGNLLTVTTTQLYIALPAGFDGYVFLPFEGARSLNVTDVGYYDRYDTYPENMVDLSKDYTMVVFLGDTSWSGLNLTLDDILIYTGSEHADHIALLKKLGYKGITAVPQPSKYSFPFTFDDGLTPFKAVNNIYDNAEHLQSGGIDPVSGKDALVGKVSMQIDKIAEGNQRTDTNYIKMEGIKGFNIKDFSKTTGLLLRIKIENDKTNDFHNFGIGLTQDGVKNKTWLGCRAVAYDLEGNKIKTPSNALYVKLPSGFDGYVFFPFEGARSLTVTDVGYYDRYDSYPKNLVDLSKDYQMYFSFQNSTWNGTKITFDDLRIYSGNQYITILKSLYKGIKTVQQPDAYTFPLTFDTGMTPFESSLDDGMKVWKEGKYGTAATLTYEETSISNRTGLVINFSKDDIATGSNYYTSSAPFKAEAGVKGLMLRVKTNAEEEATLGIRTGYGISGEDEILFGKPPVLFDKDGNSVDQAIGGSHWRGVYLPEEFDGFIFIPFSNGFIQAINNYVNSLGGWAFESQIRNLQLIFFGDKWIGKKIEIDYIGTYSDTQYLQCMESAGYTLDYDTGLLPAQIMGEGGKLFFFNTTLNETFDQKSLDKLKDFNILNGANKYLKSTFDANNVALDYGNLKLTYKKVGDEYTTGGIMSAQSYSYGYYEASIKLPKLKGAKSTFSLVTENDFREGGTTFQVDIAYLNELYELITGYGYMKDGKPLARKGEIVDGALHPAKATSSYAGAYHTYGLLYTYKYLRFYVDGVLVRVVENDFARGNVFIKIAGEVPEKISEKLTPKNDSIYVDYVRYWTLDSDEMTLYDEEDLTNLSLNNPSAETKVKYEKTFSVPLAVVSAVLAVVAVVGYVLAFVLFRKGKAGK